MPARLLCDGNFEAMPGCQAGIRPVCGNLDITNMADIVSCPLCDAKMWAMWTVGNAYNTTYLRYTVRQ